MYSLAIATIAAMHTGRPCGVGINRGDAASIDDHLNGEKGGMVGGCDGCALDIDSKPVGESLSCEMLHKL